jgi:hypothetical protein
MRLEGLLQELLEVGDSQKGNVKIAIRSGWEEAIAQGKWAQRLRNRSQI